MGIWDCLPLSPAYYNEIQNVPKTVEEAFKEAAQGKEYLSPADLKRFFETYQGDASITDTQAEAMITEAKDPSSPHHHHHHHHHHEQGSTESAGMDLAAFTKLLLNPIKNGPLKPSKVVRYMTPFFCLGFDSFI